MIAADPNRNARDHAEREKETQTPNLQQPSAWTEPTTFCIPGETHTERERGGGARVEQRRLPSRQLTASLTLASTSQKRTAAAVVAAAAVAVVAVAAVAAAAAATAAAMAAPDLEVKMSAVIEAFNNVMEESEKLPEDKKLSSVDGIKYPSLLQADTLKLLPGFVARPDDVLLVTYPKSGCNWVSRLLQNMLYMAHPALEEAMKGHAHLPLLEFGPPGKIKDLDAAPSPRLFVTHLSDLVPKGFFQCGCKVVLVFREPKDTAVSFYHFYNNNPGLPSVGSWEEFFRMFMEGDVAWGSYFDHVKFWSKCWEDKNILTSTYEELKADLPGELQKMSTFLGLGLSGEQISTVAVNGTFSAMKAKAEADNLKFGKVVFRKGEVGDWKNYFSEEQSAELDASYAESLAGTSLATRLNY
ncbi:unnamed protein product [Lampetra fluviatilis]